MRITGEIREYIRKQVEQRMPKPEILKESERTKGLMGDMQKYAEYEMASALDELKQKLEDKFGVKPETFFIAPPSVNYRPAYYNNPYRKASDEYWRAVDNKVTDIVVACTLGADREELNRMIEECGAESK